MVKHARLDRFYTHSWILINKYLQCVRYGVFLYKHKNRGAVKPMLRLNKANFSTKVQEILERFYLQPINGSKKINLKDGHIERSIHGAMHASRATLWALVMQNLLQKLAP
jgi:hypothetical protein